MKRYFTYLLVLLLFTACLFNESLVPNNLSDRFLGVVKRNIKKDKQELLEDMKEITRQGLIHFEVYDEAGDLITILKNPQDFEGGVMRSIRSKNFSIKSVSNTAILGQIQLNNTLR